MKKRVVFLPVPGHFQEQLAFGVHDGFFIDPDIPIPAEIPENAEETDLRYLSIETILSAMLRVIEEGHVEQKWIDYYCNFILYVRPDILTKIKNIKNDALNDDRYKNAYNLILEGKGQEALNCIRSFIECYPNIWNGWFILGWALRLLERWKDGEAALNKTMELGGVNSSTRNELAICLMETGDLQGARAQLEAALKEEPENVKIISNLGVLSLKSGEKDKAAGFISKILERDKNEKKKKKYLKDLIR
jgi:tetratricopeptide (TPR) repeat protein